MKPVFTRYRCDICGARLRDGMYVYSRFTKKRYCVDVKKHDQLRKKRRRAA